MEPAAFDSQVINFGQCPIQLFKDSTPHPPRQPLAQSSLALSVVGSEATPAGVACVVLPANRAPIPLNSGIILQKYYLATDRPSETLSLYDLNHTPLFSKFNVDFPFINHIAVSPDGLFVALSLAFGRVDISILLYSAAVPHDLVRYSSFSGPSPCRSSAIFLPDFLCASAFDDQIVIWSIATSLRHRTIPIASPCVGLLFDDFDGTLTALHPSSVRQYTINADLKRDFKPPADVTCGTLLTTLGHDFHSRLFLELVYARKLGLCFL